MTLCCQSEAFWEVCVESLPRLFKELRQFLLLPHVTQQGRNASLSVAMVAFTEVLSVRAHLPLSSPAGWQGRLRVQDPRLFDSCSMRRVPCATLAGFTIGNAQPVANAVDRVRVPNLDAEGALDGVTLLVGRKACDRTGEPSGEEEVGR